MRLPLDISKIIGRKGLVANTPYVATVVDNVDPEKLCRVRARVPHFFDHLPDDKLPWATPIGLDHPMGLKGGEDIDRTGRISVPFEGTKIALYFNHDGDPLLPTYDTRLPIDQLNQLPEALENYPNRLVTKLPNGYTHIIDTQTNEVFIQNPGDMNVTILGDANMQVIGNLQVNVSGSTGDIPAYISNAPETVIGDLRSNPSRQIEFQGLYGGQSGNAHIKTSDNFTIEAGKNIQFKAAQKIELKAGSKMNLKAGPKIKARASIIELN